MKTIINLPSPVKCKTCGCKFIFEYEDTIFATRLHSSWLFGKPVGKECMMVKCPACGDEIILKWY